MKSLIIATLALLLSFPMTSCGKKTEDTGTVQPPTGTTGTDESEVARALAEQEEIFIILGGKKR